MVKIELEKIENGYIITNIRGERYAYKTLEEVLEYLKGYFLIKAAR